MRLLLSPRCHHPQALEDAAPARPGEEAVSPRRSGNILVKALRRQGQMRGLLAQPRARSLGRTRQLRMTQRMTPARAISALAGRVPALNPDIRLRNRAFSAQAARLLSVCDHPDRG